MLNVTKRHFFDRFTWKKFLGNIFKHFFLNMKINYKTQHVLKHSIAHSVGLPEQKMCRLHTVHHAKKDIELTTRKKLFVCESHFIINHFIPMYTMSLQSKGIVFFP